MSIQISPSLETRLNNVVKYARAEISSQYDVWAGEYANYRGLCNTTSDLVLEQVRLLMQEISKSNPTPIEWFVEGVHGEQGHNPSIPSKYWFLQHTLVCLSVNDETWYLDATSSQFQWLYPDIPNYYVGKQFPKWYYNDRKNPAWNGWTNKLNEKWIIHHKVKNVKGETYTASDGIIEYIQYEIWGKISDFIRFILRRKEPEYIE